MNLTTFAQLGRRGRRLVWGGALTGLLLAAGTTAIGDVSPEARRSADQRRQSLSLFAGPTAILQGNQIQCGVDNQGNVCTDVFNSPTGGGGFWPTGSPNQYIFNTGLQIAGIMGPEAGPWANDTVGAFFFDASGTVPSGSALTNIFNSLDADDVANWPAEAFVSDPTLFQEVLVGRKTASQQDSWVQYWDGDPSKISGRQHPMGIQVTQRSLAWNYPAGNEALIYFIYNFQNATADPDFQSVNEALFFAGNNSLPDGGIGLSEIYGAFATDMDVTANAGQNFSTAILPLDLGISYHGGFSAPEFSYTPDLFFPPFFTNAPGLIGIKYLRSPTVAGSDPPQQVGLTLFSATLNSATGFPDPRSDKQLWRYLSGKLNPAQGDFPCNVSSEVVSSDPNAVRRSLCFLAQTSADTRFYQASGPFGLAPGEDATIVVAYIAAATVATLPDGSPSGIIANASDDSANPPGVPSFHPGFPSARGCTTAEATSCTEVDNANPVKAIERGAGWVAYAGAAPDNALEGPSQKIDQNQISTVPLSLMGRALVAQSIFDNRFLLGFAPEQPVFYLVPGDNQVVVVWEPSITEDSMGDGDPFFQVASDTTSPLFNPNYRQFDVEGYRIWRGTSAGNLQLIGQFDYANTTFTDVTCETVLPTDTLTTGVGFAGGETCPSGFTVDRTVDETLVFNNGGGGTGPGGGTVRLNDDRVIYNGDPLAAVSSDDAGPFLPLSNSGVPFVFTDSDVTNNFTYFYAVSAFDVNSPASGPATLRSARVTKNTVPRADAPNQLNATLNVALADADGNTLVVGNAPAIDAADGTFAGPFPPTNGLLLSFAPLVPRLLPTFSRTARIDSLTPGLVSDPCEGGVSGLGTCWNMYLTVNADGVETETVIDGFTPVWSSFGEPDENVVRLIEAQVAFDQDALDAFGIPSGSGFATADATFGQSISYSAFEGQATRRGLSSRILHGGSRWFSGANESVADPAKYIEVGQLDGVTQVWAPIHHTPLGPGNATTLAASGSAQCMGYGFAFLGRSADVEFTWSGGTISEVRDVSHNTPVDFKPTVQASWGFLNGDGNGNGVIDWDDFFYIENISPLLDGGGPIGSFCNHTDVPASRVTLESTPTFQGVLTDPLVDPQTAAAPAPSGQGFGLYVNGERYIFVVDAPPADGTVWTLRTYNGRVRVDAASVDTDDPNGYSYRAFSATETGLRPPTIPGLQMVFNVDAATNLTGAVDLTQIHTVPDPYLGSSLYDRGPTTKQLMFVNLPESATIRIYTLTGVLVDVLVHDDVTGGGREVWDIRNRNNQFVASGVYFFHVLTPKGEQHVGKFTIINQAGSN